MKKIFYTLSLFTLAVVLFACNSTSSGWSREQRATMRRALHEYRDMVYLDELTDAEFFIFADNATDVLEEQYPNFDAVMTTPAFGENINTIVTTIIVEQLDADGSNIRHIYPYRELKKQGRIPAKLSRKEQRSFYKCLARKIDNQYDDFGAFFNAILADTTNTSQIATFEAECAKSLFNWDGKSCVEGEKCDTTTEKSKTSKETTKRKKW